MENAYLWIGLCACYVPALFILKFDLNVMFQCFSYQSEIIIHLGFEPVFSHELGCNLSMVFSAI